MPCRTPSHKHDWPRSGTLSISKCESKCAFCSSTKDYKPASALRKHVLTHIRNDKMPLTLDKSTGGRPRLQTTAIDPSSRDQPEIYPPSPELTLTSGPVPVALDAQGHTIDDIVLSIKNMFSREDINSLYSQRCGRVPDALKIVEAAVGFSKTFGPEKILIRLGLECLRILMVEYGYSNYHFTVASNFRQSNRTSSDWYLEFCQALHDNAWGLRFSKFSKPSMMVLETFYATWILSMIIRFDRAYDGGGLCSTYHESILFRLILPSFEERNMPLDDLCDEVYRANLPEYFRDKDAASGLYRRSIFGPASLLPSVVRERSLGESIRLLIEDLEPKMLDEIRPGERAILDD